jgi:stage II sporulation protein M
MPDPMDPPVFPPHPSPIRRFGGFVRRLYLDEWEMWRAHYRKSFKVAARLLGIGFLFGFLFFTMRPDQERRALTGVLKALKDIPLDASPPVLALNLFYHNARASFFAAAAGWIPFLCLPAFDPLLNGAVLGLVVSIARHMGMNVPVMVLTGIAPHGIFELPAILYVTSIGITISLTLGKRILASHPSLDRFRRAGRAAAGEAAEDEAGTRSVEALPGIRELATKTVRSFGLVVLPLLLVAAVVEAFVTSLLS